MSLHSRTLVIVVNDPSFFLSHRLNIALRAKEIGMRVTVVTPPGPSVEDIKTFGLHWVPWNVSRWGSNPLRELAALAEIRELFARLKPDVVHLVTIKPVIYGALAARSLKIPARVSAISGLGQVFTSRGLKAACRRAVVRAMYRLALGGRNSRVIFQNEDDQRTFIEAKLVEPAHTVLIRGAGVDTGHFSPGETTKTVPTVLFASRLLREKGICEFIEAARILKNRGVPARFVVAGMPVPGNPASISEVEFERWKSEGIADFVGYQGDMLPLFRASSIAALPSYYGEGIPKFLIEAAACGLPIVTTDWPGCRDIVRHGENGVLVAPRSSESLADALQELLDSPEKCAQLGAQGRDRVLRDGFSQEVVVKQTIELYSSLISDRALK